MMWSYTIMTTLSWSPSNTNHHPRSLRLPISSPPTAATNHKAFYHSTNGHSTLHECFAEFFLERDALNKCAPLPPPGGLHPH